MSVKSKVSKLLYGEGPKRSRYIAQGMKSYAPKGALAGGVAGRVLDGVDALTGGMDGSHLGNIAMDMAAGGAAGAGYGALKGNKAYKAALKKHKMRKNLVNAGLTTGAIGTTVGGAALIDKRRKGMRKKASAGLLLPAAAGLGALGAGTSALGAAGAYTTSDRGAGGRSAVGGGLIGPVGAVGGLAGGAALGAATGAGVGAVKELMTDGGFRTLMRRNPRKAKGFIKRLLQARDARKLKAAKKAVFAEMKDTALRYGKRGAFLSGAAGIPLGALAAGGMLGSTMGRRPGAKTTYEQRTMK